MGRSFKVYLLTFGFAFTVAFFAASNLITNSWGGIVFFHTADGRTPASINKVYDFSNLEGHALQQASHKRIIADAKVLNDNGIIGLELGHFVTKNENGKKDLACNTYNRIRLQFSSIGMAVNGAPSDLFVEADCDTSEDINKISAIWIPVQQIKTQPASDFEIEYFGKRPVKFKFENMGAHWPEQWALKSVQLYNENEAGQQMVILQSEIRKLRKQPIVMNWNHPPN